VSRRSNAAAARALVGPKFGGNVLAFKAASDGVGLDCFIGVAEALTERAGVGDRQPNRRSRWRLRVVSSWSSNWLREWTVAWTHLGDFRYGASLHINRCANPILRFLWLCFVPYRRAPHQEMLRRNKLGLACCTCEGHTDHRRRALAPCFLGRFLPKLRRCPKHRRFFMCVTPIRDSTGQCYPARTDALLERVV
jgi:hypothetical protein